MLGRGARQCQATLASPSARGYRFRMEINWEERYRQVQTPWDTGHPSAELNRVLDEYHIPPGTALDVGCGTGINVLFLASRGHRAVGLDLSPTAIAAARPKAAVQHVQCEFVCGDLLAVDPPVSGPFQLIFDRGCFHAVRQINEAAMVRRLHDWLADDGWLLLLAGNARETREHGPPRVSEAELHRAFDERFNFIHLREFEFDASPTLGYRPLAWSVLLRKKSPVDS